MLTNTQKLTRTGLLTALSCVLISVTSFFPTLDLTITAFSGLITAVVMIHCGTIYSVSMYAATSILAFIILPDKTMAVLYAAFFGYYPILKSWFEKLNTPALRWGAKLVLFNAVYYVLWFLLKNIFIMELPQIEGIIFLAQLVLNGTFVVYDIGMTRLIFLYINKLSKKLGS